MAFDVDIRGTQYRVGKLSAMKQLHVSRKIAPLLPPLLPIMLRLDAGKPGALTENLAALPELVQPFADGLAALPDEHADYVVGECLAVVQRRQGNAWFSIWAAGAKQPTYDDIDLAVVMDLTVKVIADSLGPFIAGWRTSQESHPPTTA